MVEAPRNTRQRRAVVAILEDLDGFASAQEIHDILKKRGESVGLSTVYRSLQVLADAAEVDALRNDDGEVLYRQCSAGHHHHLVCRSLRTYGRGRGPDGGALGRQDRRGERLPGRRTHAGDLRYVRHLRWLRAASGSAARSGRSRAC